jgi:hypothetical protein
VDVPPPADCPSYRDPLPEHVVEEAFEPMPFWDELVATQLFLFTFTT